MQRAGRVIARVLAEFGVARLAAPDSGEPPKGWSARDWRMLNALVMQPKAVAAEINEGPPWTCGEQARAAGDFGATPTIVLSADLPKEGAAAAWHTMWIKSQARLALRSTRGHMVVVTGSDHMIPYRDPYAIVRAVREMVDGVRKITD